MCDLDDVPYESDADPETYDPIEARLKRNRSCLLYTSDAADE